MARTDSVQEKAGDVGTDVAHPDTTHIPQILVESEDEPQSPYHLSWRTLLAFVALAMGNSCAALANTVSRTTPLSKLAVEIVSGLCIMTK